MTEKEMLRRYFQAIDEQQFQELSEEQDKVLAQARINMLSNQSSTHCPETFEEEPSLRLSPEPSTADSDFEENLKLLADFKCTDQTALTEALLSAPQGDFLYVFL